MGIFPRALQVAFLSALCTMAPTRVCLAQAIDSVFVEVYHVQESGVPGEPPITTYRIYVDLAADHELQMVYGDDKHQLRLFTSTAFLNDTMNGAMYGHMIDGDHLNSSRVALDSWLTIGAASDAHWGVPRSLDEDGSILECPPYPGKKGMQMQGPYATSTPLNVTDGLLPHKPVSEIVNFNFNPTYLRKVRGNFIETTNGAWAVLGGTKGVTDRNLFLIAQLTTTGSLAFRLNLQIETPDHEPVKYVAGDPAPGEVLYQGLNYGSERPLTAPSK